MSEGAPFDEILAYQIRTTRPGMAHWANSGPFGATCGECAHFGCRKQVRDAAGNIVSTTRVKGGCAKFLALTGKHGPAVPPSTPACKYFERPDGPPDVFTARAR